MIPYRFNQLGLSAGGFTRLQYLESTGTQWIDSGITPAQSVTIEFEFEFVGSIEWYWFGIRPSSDVSVNNISGRGAALDFANGNFAPYRSLYASAQQGTRYTCVLSRQFRRWMSGNTVLAESTAYNTDTFTTDLSYHLFRVNGQSNTSSIRCYRCSFFGTDGAPVCQLVPALDKQGVPCMFDQVTKQFLYNQGTGQFLYA